MSPSVFHVLMFSVFCWNMFGSSEPPVPFFHPKLNSWSCRSHTFRCPCTAPGRKHISQHQPGEGHLSGLMWLTSMHAFKVFTSSALNVQCGRSLLQRLFQLLQSFIRRSQRDTIPEQTNAAVAGFGTQGRACTWRFAQVTGNMHMWNNRHRFSLSAECACMTMRNNQPKTSVSQDDNDPDLTRMSLKQALST